MAIQYTATDFMNTLANNNYSYTGSYKKNMLAVDEDMETLQDSISSMRKLMRGLASNTSDNFSKTKLETQLTEFVSSYNTMVSDAGDVSNDNLEKQLKKLTNLVSDNEDLLEEIGITVTDGIMSFDTEDFEDASKKTISKIFDGNDAFVYQADRIIKKMDRITSNAQYTTVERSIGTTVTYDDSEINTATTLINIQGVAQVLNAYSEAMQEDDEETVKDYLEQFASLYNDLNDSSVADSNSDLQALLALYNDNENALNALGYSFNEESGEMVYDADEDIDSSAYLNLFGDDSNFYNNIVKYCTSGVGSVLNTSVVNVSIVDTYA